MNVYIWQYVEKCTDRYNSGGGVVVFADTEERARELANHFVNPDDIYTDKDVDDPPRHCKIAPDEMPDEVRTCGGIEEKVFIFPDSGCC